VPIDISEAESPGWWLDRCAKKLARRHPRLTDLANWMDGESPYLKDADAQVADAYKRFRKNARTNYAELIVLTLRRRLVVTGFRTSEDQSRTGDDVAMRIWKRNGMQIELPSVIENALGLGDGYTMLGKIGEGDAAEVSITAEDPRQAVTIHDPVRQRNVRAGLKLYHDADMNLDVAYLHLPGKVYKAKRPRKATAATQHRVPTFSSTSWDWDEDAGGEAGQDTGVKRPLIVRFRNRNGVGEFENHLYLLERLDDQVFRRDVIAAMQAFRQLALLSKDPEVLAEEDDEGRPIDWDDILTMDPGAFWRLPGVEKVWESQVTDITPLISADTADIKKLSAVTSTPMHVFIPDAASSGSAEGAALLREEHEANAEDKLTRFNESVIDTMSLAFELEGDEQRSRREHITVLWKPIARRSLAERGDANSKMQDVPWRTRMTRVLEFDEDEVDRMEVERQQDAIRDRIAQRQAALPTPTPPTPPAPDAGAGG